MSHMMDSTVIGQGFRSAEGLDQRVGDPIAAAAAGIEQCLAMAHEAGQEEAIRLLHAVLGLLSAAPRH